MQQSPCCVWDFTLNVEEFSPEIVDLLATNLEKWCKKWIFQAEIGSKRGNKHYQGKFSLNLKERLETLVLKFPKCHLSRTVTENIKVFAYVMKEETRVDGPWRNDEYIRIPKDVKLVLELRPWQASLLTLIQEYQQRKVYVVYDPTGNSGKSTFARWCACYNHARRIPFANDYKDLLRMVMDMPVAKAYIFDMPRAINKEKLYQFYAAVEEIKSGYAFDDRYHFKERYFDPPNVVIFTNSLPEQSLLSRDRWTVFTITKDSKLESLALRCNSRNSQDIDFKIPELLELPPVSTLN